MRLAGSVELRDLEGKGMIEIGVYGNDPQEAANIATTIAIVYLQKRIADYDRVVDRGLAELKDEVEKQRLRTADALAEAEVIRNRDGIIDPTPDDDGATKSSANGAGSLGPYVEAKTRARQVRRIYEAARTKYATELLTHDESYPARIWEKAEPPIGPIGFSFRQITHALSR